MSIVVWIQVSAHLDGNHPRLFTQIPLDSFVDGAR